ncbi:CaiB/BaiF CoA transferase family protein [Zhongshania sp.]|uniref:CaiB/BaiF CoA transferase family protein n=1 Tax=Zhongshania sp. TaxID=1971902 RepID=UPI0035684656
MTSVKRGGPLQGVRVIELTKVWAGPYIGKLLAFLGAEVIRIESDGSLDVTRTFGVDDINKAPGFMAVNPQKLSMQIDVKTEAGVGLLMDLLKESDILIENLRPGAAKRLGFGYEQVKAVKPDIICVSMGMHGTEGPLSYQTGYAPCFAALGGLSSLVGYEGGPPAGMNVRYADSTFGAVAAYAAVIALNHRRRTGEGQFVDVSAVESMSSMIGDAIMDYSLNGTVRECDNNKHPEMAPHGVYPCRDGEWLSLAVSEANWPVLLEKMDRQAWRDDSRFANLAARKANEQALNTLIAEWTLSRDAQAVSELLQAAGIAATKSASSVDLISDQHLWARGFYHDVTSGDGESRPILGPGWHMSRGADINAAAPRLGEHNAYVLGEILGLSAEEQEKLGSSGVVR